MIVSRIDMRGRDIFRMSEFPREYVKYEYGVSTVAPIKETSELRIIIDPSKTESGVIISTAYGEVLEILTMSGVYAKSQREDTMDFCRDVKQYFLERFAGAHVEVFAKEQTIMKKGTEFYHSMKVLESLSTMLDDTSKILTGSDAFPIPNWSWKSHILPDGYRSQKEKGSFRWMYEQNPAIRNLSDNITDVYCMYLYLRDYKLKCSPLNIYCDKEETTDKKLGYIIVNTDDIPKGVQQFTYNEHYTLEHNCNYYINRSKKPGFCLLDINTVLPAEIIGHAYNIRPHREFAVIVKEGEF